MRHRIHCINSFLAAAATLFVLLAFHSSEANGAPPAIRDEVTTSAVVATAPTNTKPLGSGSKAPDVQVFDRNGNAVMLGDVYSSAPTVVIFYRGGWCPYCNTHLRKLATIEDDLTSAGYQIVAISPDAPKYLNETAGKAKANYTLLSDSSAKAIRAFGLAFRVDDPTVSLYRDKYKIDLEMWAGDQGHHILPVPAAYIVDREGTIRYAYTNPDYKARIDEKELLQQALKLQ